MKLFKKLTALLLVLAMMFAFAACSSSDSDKDDKDEDKTEESSQEDKSEASEEDEKSEDEKSEDEKSEDEKSEDEKSKEDDTVAIVGEWNGTMDMSGMISLALGSLLGFEVDLNFAVDITMEFDDNGEYTMIMDVDSAIAAGEQMLEDIYAIYADSEEDPVDYETFIAQTDMDSFVDSMTAAEETVGEYELDGDKLYMDGDTENYLEFDGDTISGEIAGLALFELERA